MGEIIRNLSDGSRMLCPQSAGFPIASEHVACNGLLDAFYQAAERDTDGELTPPLDVAYAAAAYGPVSARMNLYRHVVEVLEPGRETIVETWWWRCPVCGFVLPAQVMNRVGY